MPNQQFSFCSSSVVMIISSIQQLLRQSTHNSLETAYVTTTNDSLDLNVSPRCKPASDWKDSHGELNWTKIYRQWQMVGKVNEYNKCAKCINLPYQTTLTNIFQQSGITTRCINLLHLDTDISLGHSSPDITDSPSCRWFVPGRLSLHQPQHTIRWWPRASATANFLKANINVSKNNADLGTARGPHDLVSSVNHDVDVARLISKPCQCYCVRRLLPINMMS